MHSSLVLLRETPSISKPPLDLSIVLLSLIPSLGSSGTRTPHSFKGNGIFRLGWAPLETSHYVLMIEAFLGQVFDV